MKKVIGLCAAVMMASVLLCSCTKSVENVWLDKDYISVEHGQSFSLTAIALPEDAENKEIEWEISDPNIVSTIISNLSTREFKADNIGETKIVAKSNNGKMFACSVVVTENAEDIAIREKREEEERIEREKQEEERRIAEEKAKEEATHYIGNGIAIEVKNRFPAKFNEYFSGQLERSYEITRIDFRNGWLNVSGKKLSDTESSPTSCRFTWSLQDENGTIVNSSGYDSSPSVGVGQTWKAQNVHYFGGLEPGYYVLIFTDVQW